MIMPTPSRRDGGDDSGGCRATAFLAALVLAGLGVGVVIALINYLAA